MTQTDTADAGSRTTAAATQAITVEISAEGGALIHGTTKGEPVAYAAVKAIGAKWSRTLNAWYLPRTLRAETTRAKVIAFVAALTADGRTVTVEDHTGSLSLAERREARDERLADRADRLEVRAERKESESDAAYGRFRQIAGGIPFGQPILVGHHSEARARADVKRMESAIRTSIDADAEAARAAALAAGIRSRLERGDAPVTIANRIERNAAERRKIQRTLDGDTATPEQWAAAERGQLLLHKPATGGHRDRLLRMTDELDEALTLDTATLEELRASGKAVEWSQAGIRKGDFVSDRFGWHKVARVNKKTVSVETPYTWTDAKPWQEIKGARRALEDGSFLKLDPHPAAD